MSNHHKFREVAYPGYHSLQDTSLEESSYHVLLAQVVRQLREMPRTEGEPPDISKAAVFSDYSNELLRLTLEDGRSLIVKRARYGWAGPRFESARRASLLLRRDTRVITPEHILLKDKANHRPVLAYWYIPLPTLEELWPGLSSGQRAQVLRSLGRLLRQVHRVKVERFGPVGDQKHVCDSLSVFMVSDLRERLKPAIWAEWPDALPLTNRLTEMAGRLPEPEGGARLVHNDVHLGNILCQKEEETIRCVGLLDLEEAGGGRPASDLASAMVLHDPLFAEESGKGDWEEHFDRYLLEGYGEEPDPAVLRFFRGYHLLNLGFFSALSGDDWHACHIADAIRQLL